MDVNSGFLGQVLRPGKKHPGLANMNVDQVLSELDIWFNRRAEMDLPMLFVLDGAPAAGKSSLAKVLSSDEDSVHWVGIEHISAGVDLAPAGTTTVIVDDADQCDQSVLLKATDNLLDKGVLVILLVQARHRVAPGLLAKAGSGSITKDGARLNPHQGVVTDTEESPVNDQTIS